MTRKETAGEAASAQTEADAVCNYIGSAAAKPSDTILVVFHHSVIPTIIGDFGFKNESPIEDATEFDRVYVDFAGSGFTIRISFCAFTRYGGTW